MAGAGSVVHSLLWTFYRLRKACKRANMNINSDSYGDIFVILKVHISDQDDQASRRGGRPARNQECSFSPFSPFYPLPCPCPCPCPRTCPCQKGQEARPWSPPQSPPQSLQGEDPRLPQPGGGPRFLWPRPAPLTPRPSLASREGAPAPPGPRPIVIL